MSDTKPYREFRIEIRPSPASNDHEVRFFGDGEDLIGRFWNEPLGLDPDDILANPCPLRADAKPHRAIIARCSCGVLGCGDIEVEVSRSADRVEWTPGSADSAVRFGFLAISYDAEVERALSDTSWETPDRTAARLLAGHLDRQALANHGLFFGWASGRVREGAFSVSLNLEPGPYQILVHLLWNAEPPEVIAREFARLLRDHPANWADAEWFPQRVDLGPPSLAGESWRRGGS